MHGQVEYDQGCNISYVFKYLVILFSSFSKLEEINLKLIWLSMTNKLSKKFCFAVLKFNEN